MVRKQGFIGAMMVLLILACQSTAAPNPSPGPGTTETAEIPPTDAIFIPTALSREEGIIPQPNFLADPNTACVFHDKFAKRLDYDNYTVADSYHVLTCLDRDGWHVYGFDDFRDPLNPTPGRPPKPPVSITACPDGRIFTDLGAVYLLERGLLFKLIRPGWYEFNGVNIACGAGDDFWMSTEGNIYYFDGETWIEHPGSEFWSSDTLAHNYSGASPLVLAPNGDLWALTPKSIARFDGTAWQVFEAGKGFEEFPHPYELMLDAKGTVWASSEAGLLMYDGRDWSTFPTPDGLDIGFLRLDHQDRVWAAVTNGGFYIFDPQAQNWDKQFGREAISGSWINDIVFDGQGRLWIATNYGLDIFDGSGWTVYQTHTSGLYSNIAKEIVVLGDGPQLPALMAKTPGSLHGKLVNPDPAIYANKRVEICLEDTTIGHGETPCADQPFHAVATVDTDGDFLFTDIPVGTYFLMIERDEKNWYRVQYFQVNPGSLTEFGEIVYTIDAEAEDGEQ